MKLVLNNDDKKALDVKIVNYNYLNDVGVRKTINMQLDLATAEKGIAVLVAMVENGENVSDFYLEADDGKVLYNHVKEQFSITNINDHAEGNDRYVDIELTKI